MLSRGKILTNLALKNQNDNKVPKKTKLLKSSLTVNKELKKRCGSVNYVNSDLIKIDECVRVLLHEIIENVCDGEEKDKEDFVVKIKEAESENIVTDSGHIDGNVRVIKEKKLDTNELNNEVPNVIVETADVYTALEECIDGNDITEELVVEDFDVESLGTLFSVSGSEYIPSDLATDDETEDLDGTFNDEEMANETTEQTNGRRRRGRKRKYGNQSRDERKKKCNNNEEYINVKGNTVAPKMFLDEFQCVCKRKCTESVDLEARKKLFTQFWSIGSFSGRCVMINMCVKEIPKKRSYTKDNNSKRKNTRKYYCDNKEICKTTFLKTLQINQRRIDVALRKRGEEKIEDLRGSNSGGRNKVSDEKMQKVINHIKSFPRYISHYCRRDTESLYLNADLNLKKMYSLYIDSTAITEDQVSFSTYKKIFYTKFNLRFQKPKKDTCLKCDKYQAQIKGLSEGADTLKEEHSCHIKKADDLREQMNNDLKSAKNHPEIETLTFDLQKTHPLPKLPTGIVYYKRQLNLHNLGIHVGSTGKGIFNIWMEHEAGRGTQEVGSCLRKYIEQNIKAPVKDLILWSDSCGGQNRSINLVLIMMHTLQNHPSLESITLRFLLSGHSFLPNDSEFGDVERSLKIQQRLYTDDEYIAVMKECRRKNKFNVNKMHKGDMFSVNKLLDSITNRKVDSAKEKVSWLKTHEIKLLKNEPFTLHMKGHVWSESLEQIVDLEKRKKGRQLKSFKDIQMEKLWPLGKPLSKEKLKDLKDILKLVPQDIKPFYNFLRAAQQGDFEDDVEGFGVMNVDFEVEGSDEEN